VALLKNDEYNESYKELCEAIRLNPEDYESRCALGDVYCAIGRSQLSGGKPGEAIESFREAVKIDPDYPDYHNCLGQALLERARSGVDGVNGVDEDQLNSAVAEFRAAIGIDPEGRDARVNLGRALSLSSSGASRAEGIELLNELLLADPFNDDVKSCIEALTADSHEA
jgi:cytochrome c-type biogenesis protein CcmH/NrfG